MDERNQKHESKNAGDHATSEQSGREPAPNLPENESGRVQSFEKSDGMKTGKEPNLDADLAALGQIFPQRSRAALAEVLGRFVAELRKQLSLAVEFLIGEDRKIITQESGTENGSGGDKETSRKRKAEVVEVTENPKPQRTRSPPLSDEISAALR